VLACQVGVEAHLGAHELLKLSDVLLRGCFVDHLGQLLVLLFDLLRHQTDQNVDLEEGLSDEVWRTRRHLPTIVAFKARASESLCSHTSERDGLSSRSKLAGRVLVKFLNLRPFLDVCVVIEIEGIDLGVVQVMLGELACVRHAQQEHQVNQVKHEAIAGQRHLTVHLLLLLIEANGQTEPLQNSLLALFALKQFTDDLL